jgi:hypothetical protein
LTDQAHKNHISFLKYFDLKMGIVGGLFLGTVVFLINFDHGTVNALIAALKQATYTFFAGGFMLRLTENVATSIDGFYKAIFTACLVSTTVAVTLTFIVHSLRGTPEPFYSTIPTMVFSPWGLERLQLLPR